MTSTTNTRKSGRVKFFNSVKGFGFIIPDDQAGQQNIEELMARVFHHDQLEVFVHHTAIHNDGGFKSLAEVEYDLVQGPKGMQAANVSGPSGVSVQGDPNAGRRVFDPNYGGNRYGNNMAYGMTGGFNPGFTGQNLYPYGGGPFPGYSQQFPTFPYPQSGSPQQQVPSTSPSGMSSAHYSQQQQGAPFAPYQPQQMQQQTRGQPGG
ncbi:hypothetical protein INT43_002335, partial [Umbelopsis isabellina]